MVPNRDSTRPLTGQRNPPLLRGGGLKLGRATGVRREVLGSCGNTCFRLVCVDDFAPLSDPAALLVDTVLGAVDT